MKSELRRCEGVCGEIQGRRVLNYQKQGEIRARLYRWPQNAKACVSPTRYERDSFWREDFGDHRTAIQIRRYSYDRCGPCCSSQPYCLPYCVFLDHPDEDTVLGGSHSKPDEIGTISVRVYLVKNQQLISTGPSARYRIQDHPPALIHEQAKKAGQHCVS